MEQQLQQEIEDKYLPKVKFEAIPINQLVSDQEYQRALSDKHVKRAVAHFDMNQINPVKVSRRDGVNYVFNGQHTMEIVKQVSGSDETRVWCMVYDNLTYEEEAHIFAEQQKHVKALVPYEVFVAHLEAGDNKQLMIHSLITNVYKLRISKTHAPGNISAISALEYIFDHYGYEILDRSLRLALGTWEGEPISLTSGMLKGIAMLVSAYGDSLDVETFKEHVGKYSAKAISRNAKDRRPGTIGFAEALVIVYNGQKKKHLSLKKLYWSNGRKKGAAPPDFETDN